MNIKSPRCGTVLGRIHFHSSVYQIGKFAECAGDLSYIQISCAAVFVSLNDSSIVSSCCFTKISQLEPWLKFKVCGREIISARQTFQSGVFTQDQMTSVPKTYAFKSKSTARCKFSWYGYTGFVLMESHT